ncbi:enhancer of mRNA-decapping protein 4 homolog isoform X2 [Haematobia irritans]
MSASPTPPLKSENIDGGLNNSTVIISFKPGDKQCCQEISNRNVRVIANPGKHDHGSSKVKLKNIVDYKWEVKNYPGHLIAVHIDEKHIAYVINALYFQVPCKIVKYPCYIPSESNRNDASDM